MLQNSACSKHMGLLTDRAADEGQEDLSQPRRQLATSEVRRCMAIKIMRQACPRT